MRNYDNKKQIYSWAFLIADCFWVMFRLVILCSWHLLFGIFFHLFFANFNTRLLLNLSIIFLNFGTVRLLFFSHNLGLNLCYFLGFKLLFTSIFTQFTSKFSQFLIRSPYHFREIPLMFIIEIIDMAEPSYDSFDLL